jgi:hypothetical protein
MLNAKMSTARLSVTYGSVRVGRAGSKKKSQ